MALGKDGGGGVKRNGSWDRAGHRKEQGRHRREELGGKQGIIYTEGLENYDGVPPLEKQWRLDPNHSYISVS